MNDYRTAPVDPEMKQLLSFAEKVSRDAGHITSSDIGQVRSAGFSDRAILDAAHVAGFFSYMNRVVLALGADGKAGAMAAEKPVSDISAREAPMQT
jgi:alkylhydroperoxidase family enzyme